ncbi:MAG: Cas10/Cmr2 second palm domain-containing protein [Pseudonocardiaceae bacterium]
MRLVLFATSANQSYIFTSNRLREAVGASELVRLATTEWVHDAVAATGPGGADVVQESSGTALLVVDGPDAGADRARRVVNELTSRVMRDAPGLDVAGASVPIDGPAPTPAQVDAVFAAHGATVARRAATLGRFPRLPCTAACASTDRPATAWHSDAARASGGGAVPGEGPRPLSAEAIAKRRTRPAADHRMGRQADVPLVDIDRFFGQVKRVAVVHADGNGLGAVFRQAAEQLGSTAEVTRLSKQVQQAADQALRHAATKLLARVRRIDGPDRRCPLVPLIVGGDDLTALVDGRFAVTFVRDYLERFGEKTSTELVAAAAGRQWLTASAGIAIVPPHFPFSAAYGIADELCASAKVPTRDNPAIHALDVHIQLDSLASDLHSIRDRYRTSDAVLHERPFLLPAPGQSLPAEAHRGLDQLTERIQAVHSLARGRADGRVVSRTQLHVLREELRTDPGRAQRRFTELWRRAEVSDQDREVLTALAGVPGDPPKLLRPATGATAGAAATTSLIDALEIAAIIPDGAL